MQPHNHGTGVVLPRHPCRSFFRISKGAGGGEQSRDRGANDYCRRLNSTTDWTVPRVRHIGMIEKEHALTSFDRNLAMCRSLGPIGLAALGGVPRGLPCIKMMSAAPLRKDKVSEF